MLLPLPQSNPGEDVVFRMTFHATNHPVQMHNRIWVSTRALELAGYQPNNQPEVAKWLNTVYQRYFSVRTLAIPDPQVISQDNLKALMQGYCDELKREPAIQEYWVVLMHGATKLDSRQMKL